MRGGRVEKAEYKKFENYLKSLVGAERADGIKYMADKNLGVSINSELLLREYPGKEFVGKNVEEARTLMQEKSAEALAPEKERLRPFFEKPDNELQKLLEENEKNQIEFLTNKEKNLAQFLESGIKNIRLDPLHAESWLNWEKVEKGKTGEFQIDSKAEEIIDRLAKASKDIDLVIPFGNENYFGKENRSNIPSTEKQIKAYTNLCGFLAEHFKGKINRFEISNEPNVKPKEGVFEGEFPNNPNPELYGKVAARAAEIIKNKNPEAKVIFGNIALFDPEFIKSGLKEVKRYEVELQEKRKLALNRGLIDYVGFHPYRENPEVPSACIDKGEGQFTKEQKRAAEKRYGYKSYEDQLEIYRRIVSDEYSSYKAQLINTEIGWQIGKEGFYRVPNEKKQAEYLLKAAAIDASRGISTNFFELFELTRGEKYSLLNKENQPKEGFQKLKNFNKYLEVCKKKKEMEPTRLPGGDVGRFYPWQRRAQEEQEEEERQAGAKKIGERIRGKRKTIF